MNDFVALVITICGLLFVRAVWIITDPRPFLTVLKWNLEWRILKQSLVDFALAIIIVLTTVYLPLSKSPFDKIINYLGLTIFLLGLVIMLWAKFTLNKSWGPLEDQHDIKRQNKLITSGPYKYSRNPMYAGFFLLYLGMFLAIRSYLIFLALFFIIKFYKATIKEEKILGKYFGKQFREYEAKTPRFI